MKKWTGGLLAVLLAAGAALFLFTYTTGDTPAITYFPMDQKTKFVHASTRLKLIEEMDKDSYRISWESESKSDQKLYLRQDAAMLFDNGRLIGIQSKWKENTAIIKMKQKLTGDDSSHFQTITYHHGEVHYPDDQIKSIHKMSYDQLYVIDSPNTPLDSFKIPENEDEDEWVRLLEHTTHQQLVYNWKNLMHHFKINSSKYKPVPLTKLYMYNDQPLPSFTQEETNQIIGQLWEGLYKNYILNAKVDQQIKSYVPLILFDKQHKHLLVLYTLNGQKEKLIQKYPDFTK
ncbi:hypothetical protein [Virgibacillus siamensis]|uniref:hypothetical protein n=1 Tax=Virgibacillus siamensis TaxID=480071 RepID=UPI00098501CE|nr:hypothetical protein [Virgibacillus siamensis]